MHTIKRAAGNDSILKWAEIVDTVIYFHACGFHLGFGIDVVNIHGILQLKVTDAGTTKVCEIRAHTERVTKVTGNAPDIGSFRTDNPEICFRQRDAGNFKSSDLNIT
jgi:hypothetical protein